MREPLLELLFCHIFSPLTGRSDVGGYRLYLFHPSSGTTFSAFGWRCMRPLQPMPSEFVTGSAGDGEVFNGRKVSKKCVVDSRKVGVQRSHQCQGLLTQVVRLPIPDDATLDKSRFKALQYEGNKAGLGRVNETRQCKCVLGTDDKRRHQATDL